MRPMNEQKPFAISIIGRKSAGRSRALADLIGVLKSRYIRAGVIKTLKREECEVDLPGKDTFEYRARGADKVILLGSKRMAMFANLKQEVPISELLSEFAGYDLVFVEGYFSNDLPKIEFHRERSGHPLSVSVQNLVAICTDTKFEIQRSFGVPCFSIDDLKELADWLQKSMLGSPKEFLKEAR